MKLSAKDAGVLFLAKLKKNFAKVFADVQKMDKVRASRRAELIHKKNGVTRTLLHTNRTSKVRYQCRICVSY